MSEPENPELTEPTAHPDHTPHAPHPPELRERAFELHCQFQSNAAISRALGVPERTVRSWVGELLAETTGDLKKHRYDALCEAVASQRAIAAAAWQVFNLTLDHERARLAASAPQSPPLLWERGLGGEVLNESADEATQPPRDEDTDPVAAAALAPPSRVSGKGVGGLGSAEAGGLGSASAGGLASEPTTIYRSARLLHVAFNAQREIARLLRLYEDDVVPREPIEILITRNPPWPDPDPSDYEPEEDLSDDKNDDPSSYRSYGPQYRQWPSPTTSRPPAAGSLPAPDGHNARSPLPVGHDGARTARFEERGPAARSRRHQSAAEGLGVRSPAPAGHASGSPSPREGKGLGDEDSQTLGDENIPTHIENPATPATPSPSDAAPSAPQPDAPPSGPEPERPPYPIAWLFPPGAPIPRPYRNAPPRPDRAFWNNPCRW